MDGYTSLLEEKQKPCIMTSSLQKKMDVYESTEAVFILWIYDKDNL
jgi:hypothetical protein